MSVQALVLTPEQHKPALNVVGTQVTVLASNAETQGYGITLQRGDEGTGPPPHSHDWDEAFYVLQGRIHFLCDGTTHPCDAGTLVHVPRGTVHAFTYGSGGGQMLEITGSGALAAQMFEAVDSEISDGPPDVPKLLDVLKRNGVTVAAWPVGATNAVRADRAAQPFLIGGPPSATVAVKRQSDPCITSALTVPELTSQRGTNMSNHSWIFAGIAATALLAASDADAQQRTTDKLSGDPARGKYLVQVAACNDCHTPGYANSAGKVDEKLWLTGDQLGWRGPWGTTYAANLRLVAQNLTADQFVTKARSELRPPMPWFNLRDMDDRDVKAIYAYLKQLGPAGQPAPQFVPPDRAPEGPVVQFPG